MDQTHRKAERSEQIGAVRFGGRLVAASGSKSRQKGDILTDDELIENKYTERKSFSLTRALWSKISVPAILGSRRPLIRTEINDDEAAGPALVLITMHEDDYLSLRATLENLEQENENLRDAAWAYEDLRDS